MIEQNSFVEGTMDSLFSLCNLPYGVFQTATQSESHVGVAIGDYALDLTVLEQQGLLFGQEQSQWCFQRGALNDFASKGASIWANVRQRIQSLLHSDCGELQDNQSLLQQVLLPRHTLLMQLPFHIGGFTDFYASEHHATNVGKLFRGNENALLPNWKRLPVAYNGRASTVFPSGQAIIRPKGQIKLPNQEAPIYAATKKLDFELELGFFIGMGNTDARPIGINTASQHIFGVVLLNDWSARDIQAFEYQPLGPFLAKSFATSISPWVVPYHALVDMMVALPTQAPAPVEYLYQEKPMQPNLALQVAIQPRGSSTKTIICETNANELYWSMEQMLAHHTVNGCIMKPGDLLGTGTISGPEPTSWGSLLESTFNGQTPIKLNDGIERTFLEDGDTIIMTGYCQTAHGKIGFGSLEGTISPAL